MDFKNLKQEHIELNLDDIFNEYGYINNRGELKYRNNKFVKTIKLTRTKNTFIKIGDDFLYRCSGLTNIDLTPLSNVTQIGDDFLHHCSGLTNIDLTPLSNVTQIGNYFLSNCSGLTNIDLTPLSNVTLIGNYFLFGCSGLTNIDLTPLSNVTQIGDYFLSRCSRLTNIDLTPLSNVIQIGKYFLYDCPGLTSIICLDNDNLITDIIKQNYPNVEIKIKDAVAFKTWNEDKEKILKEKIFVKDLMKHLGIKFSKKNSHNYLIKILDKIKEKYNTKPLEKDLEKCINKDCIFTLEELENIPKAKLLMLNKHNSLYYCFDVLKLREYIFKKENNKYINPYTRTEFSSEDIDKILNVDIKKIMYFCE
jgi:hypothetical protein